MEQEGGRELSADVWSLYLQTTEHMFREVIINQE